VPFNETSHAATQTVVDALWRLEKDMKDILKVQAQIQNAFADKARALDAATADRSVFQIVSS
jgi:hypothetical protein